jgi:formimidoylglutamate deiminase
VEADLTWTGESFQRNIQIEIGADGRISEVGALGRIPTTHLGETALLPGMVNAHSHAFQRGLRGRGERFPAGAGSFWTWREAMYDLVETLDDNDYYIVCVEAFREMRDAGMTTVGEFHYFHHNSNDRNYARDEITLLAAKDADIRIALLNAYYATGGIGQPLGRAQRRFDGESVDAYWHQIDALADTLDPPTQQLGAVVHSIRAASLDDIAALYTEAARRDMVFHMHVEEQRREIEECVVAYGKPPMAVLADTIALTSRFTAVHCTHTTPDDMAQFLEAGGRVCVCPLTEANLGDGVPDLTTLLGRHPQLCLGSDSNARICMTEEMRLLEYAQRLTRETRGVVVSEDGNAARRLFTAATTAGAESLGVEAGRIAAGAWADFFTVDLTSPALDGADEETLLDALIFGTGNEAIGSTCVGGRWRASRGVRWLT